MMIIGTLKKYQKENHRLVPVPLPFKFPPPMMPRAMRTRSFLRFNFHHLNNCFLIVIFSTSFGEKTAKVKHEEPTEG